MIKKEMVALILAGGQGSRLKGLTKNLAKPAVPFGGKYRIIDFPLSNCSNSGIDTVGILTQYQPLALNAHIGIGKPWDLDRTRGGVKILPPYMSEEGGRWFKGTSNAIFENIHFVDTYDPDYVLILSGDHIYKMDYMKMLKYHKEKKSEVTLGVIEVPWEDTYRFGILNTTDDLKIYEFDEKPKNAKNNLASMGIYIFNWKKLKEYLIKDQENPDTNYDFGKDILPKMLNDGNDMYAYEFDGYWRDVGTLESLWEGNMEMLSKDAPLNIHDRTWKIYSRNANLPPQIITNNANVKSSMINEGCYIDGEVNKSVIFPNVKVGKNAKIIQSVIMPNVVVEDNAVIYKSIIGTNSIIKDGSVVGDKELKEITLISNEDNGLFE